MSKRHVLRLFGLLRSTKPLRDVRVCLEEAERCMSRCTRATRVPLLLRLNGSLLSVLVSLPLERSEAAPLSCSSSVGHAGAAPFGRAERERGVGTRGKTQSSLPRPFRLLPHSVSGSAPTPAGGPGRSLPRRPWRWMIRPCACLAALHGQPRRTQPGRRPLRRRSRRRSRRHRSR
jgi:hypothetical protein